MLDRQTVDHVARLAHLELTEQERERMAGELTKILEHVAMIQKLDLEGVEPTSHVVELPGMLRADQPERSLPVGLALAGAPEPGELGFGVPSPGAAPQ